jgi:hypothetical protein
MISRRTKDALAAAKSVILGGLRDTGRLLQKADARAEALRPLFAEGDSAKHHRDQVEVRKVRTRRAAARGMRPL